MVINYLQSAIQITCWLFLLQSSISHTPSVGAVPDFTCQGTSVDQAMGNCPDGGAQESTMGGNVRVLIRSAKNVPNRDAPGPATGVSDPYVRLVTSDLKRQTRSKQNTLEPSWEEELDLGYMKSTDEIKFELWDEDNGLEFSDDLLARTSVRVPFCSAFNANYSKVDCGQPFGCAASDSLWAMPERLQCIERGEIAFDGKKSCKGNVPCLDIEFRITPYQMAIELEIDDRIKRSPQISAAATIPATRDISWGDINGFAQPFFEETEVFINTNSPNFDRVKGALMVRMLNTERFFGEAEKIKFYASVNFPSTIYVCRFENEQTPTPQWILDEYSAKDFNLDGFLVTPDDNYFGCYTKDVDGTVKNKYGGIEGGELIFRTNTVPGEDDQSTQAKLQYTFNYVILAVPNIKSKKVEKVDIHYDRNLFLSFFGSYGLVCMWFIYITASFLSRIDYRVDRISNYIVSRVLTGKDANVIAGLLLSLGETNSNVEYRSHIYHIRNGFYLIFLIPFLLLIAWGFSCANVVRPEGLGLAVAFVGIAAIFSWYGIALWARSNWRNSPLTMAAFALAVLFFVIFIFSFIFADPGVRQFGWSLNLAALGLAFGTINCVPLLLLAFKLDKSQAKHLHAVVVRMAEAVYRLKDRAVSRSTKFKDLKVNKLLHALLGDYYTVNPSVGTFEYSAVLQELADQRSGSLSTASASATSAATAAPTAAAAVDPSAVAATEEADEEMLKRMKLSRRLYFVSVLTLLVYLIIAVVRTNYPSLAFLNCFTLVLLDFAHLSISHGDAKWTPGFLIALLIAGRVLIMSSPPTLWLLNYAAAYMLYSYFLIKEIINSFLPLMSKRKAGEIAFAGQHDDDAPPNPDIAGQPYFILGLLTFFFAGLTIISGFGVADNELPGSEISVLGYKYWHLSVFGLAALCVVVIGTLLAATVRAYYLDAHGLLRGRAKDSFLINSRMKLPLFLAISSEIAILVSGLIIYTATGTVAVLVGAIYLPVIAVLLGFACVTWVRNDYDLVVWPRLSEEEKRRRQGNSSGGESGGGADPSDLEVAFNMIEDLFGGKNKQPQLQLEDLEDEDVEEEEETTRSPTRSTLQGFKLPPLKVTGDKVGDVKMPPLPLKSVLRKKRQNLGIKTKTPLVKDLRGRDDAVDDDKFGNSEDVIDAADPWAQYEAEQEEEERQLRAKKATKLVVKQQSFWESKYVVWVRLAIKNSTFLKWLSKTLAQCWKSLPSLTMKKKGKVHPSGLYRPTDDSDYADGEDIPDGDVEAGELTGGVEGFDSEGVSSSVKSPPGTAGSGRKKPSSSSLTVKSRDDNDKSAATAGATSPAAAGAATSAANGDASLDGDGTEKDEMDLDGEDSALLPVDPNQLPFEKALFQGYLNREESTALAAWFGGLFVVMMFGVTLSLAGAGPVWLGHVIWFSAVSFICTMVPIIKYFNTYTFDPTQQILLECVAVAHFIFCLTFFLTHLEGDPGRVGSLWMLNYFFYFPIFTYILFEMIRWYDSGYAFEDVDTNHDGRYSVREVFSYLRATPVLVVALIIFNWELYVWVSFTVGQVATLLLILCVVAYIYIKDWATNDYYLSPEMSILGHYCINLTLFITFFVSIANPGNPIFAVSVFCFVLAFKFMTHVLQRAATMEKDWIVFFSPYVMPVYTYDAKHQDIVDENEVVLNIFYTLITAVVWGCFVAIFYYPIDIGAALACGFLLTIAALTALAVSYIPSRLAKASTMLTPEGIIEAANAAREKVDDRKLPLNMEMVDWEGEVPAFDEEAEKEMKEKRKSPLEKMKDRTALLNAIDLMNDLRALKYVREEKIKTNVNQDEEDEYEMRWYQEMWQDFKSWVKRMLEMVPLNRMEGWKRHNQGTFGFKEAGAEVFIAGKGPVSFICCDGFVYRTIAGFKDGKYDKLYPKWLDNYDLEGNYIHHVQLNEDLDIVNMMRRINDLDTAIETVFKEEMRCAIHFLLMLLVGADAKLQREQVLFQKFLRENRFRLASNGITPPPDIFSSASFSSIDIPLVAAWLRTLSADERERFHMLKATFSAEQTERDELIDSADYQFEWDSKELDKERRQRDDYWVDKMSVDIMKRKEQRVQEFHDSLQGFERQKFGQRRELWTTDHECYVDLKEMDLYERFRAECLADRNEAVEIVQSTLLDIEAAQRDARLGEYGRTYQFVDSDFMPGEVSIGEGDCSSSVLGWRCAPGIADEVILFDGGTHPDEVMEGCFNDTWLLSAINMLVAAGEFGNGIINQQIKSLFIGHETGDGETTLNTEVGAYCVQINRNSEWTPVIVDDLFPMRKKEFWTNENRGMACAHNREARGLWISVIEKAFAKYLGSYSELQRGFVHHALRDLTGCEAISLPLSAASRGVGKHALWDTINRFRSNGYILGAGTGASDLVDKEIQDMGIIFDSAYTIYDVRQVDGHKLLKLRNPPGDHEEWKGDWSDKSPLWTRRLKGKLGMTDAEDDNTFFMSFDDFCNVFRYLYVCKFYNPTKWIEVLHPGVWKRKDEALIEQMDLMEQFMQEQVEDAEQLEVNKAEQEQKKARARLDSAGGLPTPHNPGCILENNPHYSFQVFRPTDFRISVTQFHHNGRVHLQVQPFSVLVVRNDNPYVAKRLEHLRREDVVFSTGLPQYERTLNLYGSLDPGLYIVLVAAYMTGMEGNFNVSLLTNYKTEFQPIWPPMWILKGERASAAAAVDQQFKNKESKREQLVRLGGKEQARQNVEKASNMFRKGLGALFGTEGAGDDDSDQEKGSEDDDDEDEGRRAKR